MKLTSSFAPIQGVMCQFATKRMISGLFCQLEKLYYLYNGF